MTILVDFGDPKGAFGDPKGAFGDPKKGPDPQCEKRCIA